MRKIGQASRSICACLLALTPGSGCYGKNVCFTSVTKWHGDLDWNKWAKEAFFIPIYFLVIPFTGLIDFFIVNPIYFFSSDDPMHAGLAPVEGAPSYCFVWTGEQFEEASWFTTAEPGMAVLECRSGLDVAEVRYLDDGSLVLTDVRAGTAHRVGPEGLATQLWR